MISNPTFYLEEKGKYNHEESDAMHYQSAPFFKSGKLVTIARYALDLIEL